MGPFDLLRPEPPGRFGGAPPRNAWVELHNLIAAAESAREFGPEDRVRISRQHGVDLAREFLPERQRLYQTLLDDRLANADLDADDRAVLANAATTLALRPADLRSAHERAFGTVVSEAVADDCLSVPERLLLYKLQHLLGLDPRLAEGAYDVIAREHLLRTVAEALCDGELSPGEEARIALAESALSVTLPPDVQAMLAQARRRWQVHRGAMPELDAGVPLQSGEVARVQTPARWASVHAGRLAEEIGSAMLHQGRTAGQVLPGRALSTRIRAGRALLTSRRLRLIPDDGLPDEIRLDLVIQTLRFRNGIVVRTRAERHVYLDLGPETETFYAVLFRTLNPGPAASPD